jgi:hypothetical protein
MARPLRLVLAALALVGMVAPGPVVADTSDPLVHDAVRLLASGLYVRNVTAYCTQQAGLDPALLASAARWAERNRAITDKAAEVAQSQGGLGPRAQAMMGRFADETIRDDLARRPSVRAFCEALPARLDSGAIDLDRRPELAPAVRRVMGTAPPAS